MPTTPAYIFLAPDSPWGRIELAATATANPASTLWKEMLGPATFRDAKGRKHQITPADLTAIAADFGRAAATGHKAYLPNHHSKNFPRWKNFGWLTRLRVNARGRLEGLHEFATPEDAAEARKLKTSICLLRDYEDAYGNRYRWWVDHNAVIPDPQLPDLNDFVPAIAAGRGQTVKAVLLTPAAHRSKPMPLTDDELRSFFADDPAWTPPEDPAARASVERAVTLAREAEAKADDAEAKAAERIELAKAAAAQSEADDEAEDAADAKAAAKGKGVAPDAAGVVTCPDCGKSFKVKMPAAAGKAMEASRAEPTARELKYGIAHYEDIKQRVIEGGGIEPARIDRLEAKFLRKSLDRKAITLSRAPEAGDADYLGGIDTLTEVLETLVGNTAAPKGDGIQASRAAPPDRNAADPNTPPPPEQNAAAKKFIANTYGRKTTPAGR